MNAKRLLAMGIGYLAGMLVYELHATNRDLIGDGEDPLDFWDGLEVCKRRSLVLLMGEKWVDRKERAEANEFLVDVFRVMIPETALSDDDIFEIWRDACREELEKLEGWAS